MPRSIPPARPREGRLFLGAALGLAAILALYGASVNAYVSATRWVEHTLEVREGAYEWLMGALDAETGARGYIATDQPVFLEPYHAALTRVGAMSGDLRNLVADDPSQMKNVEAADRQARAVMNDLRVLVALV